MMFSLCHSLINRSPLSATLRAKHPSMTRVCMMTTSGDKVAKIVFLGTPDVAARSLELLIENSIKDNSGYEISCVVSQPPAPSGRKMKLTPSPVQLLAESKNIPLLTPVKAKDEDFLSELEDMEPDLCITAAYGQWLPKRFLAIPKLGTVNIHPSLLPLYRGAAPVQRCLENGDAKTGVSVVETVLKMDAGPIIKQIEYPLQGNEKADTLLEELFVIGTNQLIDVLPSILDVENPAARKPQVDEDASPADKIRVEESYIDFTTTNALAAHNKLRGFAIWPGVWSYFNIGEVEGPQRIKITNTVVIEETPNSRDIDTLVSVGKYYPTEGDEKKKKAKDILEVVCGDGSVLGILELQPPGKKPMDAKSFLNGLRGQCVKWTTTSQE